MSYIKCIRLLKQKPDRSIERTHGRGNYRYIRVSSYPAHENTKIDHSETKRHLNKNISGIL